MYDILKPPQETINLAAPGYVRTQELWHSTNDSASNCSR